MALKKSKKIVYFTDISGFPESPYWKSYNFGVIKHNLEYNCSKINKKFIKFLTDKAYISKEEIKILTKHIGQWELRKIAVWAGLRIGFYKSLKSAIKKVYGSNIEIVKRII